MYATIKDTILRKIEEIGWSLEELDYRLDLPEGTIGEFLSSNSSRVPELAVNRIKVFCTSGDNVEKNISNLLYAEHLLYVLCNATLLDHRCKWNKYDGTIIFTNEDTSRGIKLNICEKSEKSVIDSLTPRACRFVAGPIFHHHSHNGLEVYIVKTRDVLMLDTLRKFIHCIYVTDKNGYVVAWEEVSTDDRNNIIFNSAFNTLYRKIIADNTEINSIPCF